MIQFQTKLQSTAVAVNPKMVTHVLDAKGNGCVIYFTSGDSVNVRNEYLEVVGLIIAQQ